MSYTRRTEWELRDEGSPQLSRGYHFLKIWDFMIGDFNLQKTELLVYAVIFSIYRNFADYFTGSRAYLARWANASERAVADALKSLEEKKLIKKSFRKCGTLRKAVYMPNDEAFPECEMFATERRGINIRKNLAEPHVEGREYTRDDDFELEEEDT